MTTTSRKSPMVIKIHHLRCLLVALNTHLRHPKMIKEDNKKSSTFSWKKSYCKECNSSKENLYDFKVDRHNKGSRGVEVLKPANTHITATKNIESYYLTLQLQKYKGHFSRNIAKWERRTDFHLKSSTSKPSDLIFILPLLYNFNTSCNSNGIHGEAATWLFLHFM